MGDVAAAAGGRSVLAHAGGAGGAGKFDRRAFGNCRVGALCHCRVVRHHWDLFSRRIFICTAAIFSGAGCRLVGRGADAARLDAGVHRQDRCLDAPTETNFCANKKRAALAGESGGRGHHVVAASGRDCAAGESPFRQRFCGRYAHVYFLDVLAGDAADDWRDGGGGGTAARCVGRPVMPAGVAPETVCHQGCGHAGAWNFLGLCYSGAAGNVCRVFWRRHHRDENGRYRRAVGGIVLRLGGVGADKFFCLQSREKFSTGRGLRSGHRGGLHLGHGEFGLSQPAQDRGAAILHWSAGVGNHPVAAVIFEL